MHMQGSTICGQCGKSVPTANQEPTGHAYVCKSCADGPVPNLRPKTDGWHYSPLVGVMYGNIPVGIIAVGIGAIVYFLMR
jgi:hypothetical protein